MSFASSHSLQALKPSESSSRSVAGTSGHAGSLQSLLTPSQRSNDPGKTTGFAIPALLEWDGPVLATSVKGDLLEDTITHRRAIGETWVFDPVGSTAEPSAGWSPLHSSTD